MFGRSGLESGYELGDVAGCEQRSPLRLRRASLDPAGHIGLVTCLDAAQDVDQAFHIVLAVQVAT